MNHMQEDTIDLLALAKAMWKNILAIALAAVVVGSGAFLYTANQDPVYEASTSMFVNSNSLNLGSISAAISTADLNKSSSMVSAYLYILESRTTMEEVIQEAGLSYTPEQLSQMISTKSVANTGAFEVTVTSTKPADCELIANTIAKILPARISDIVDGASVRVVDYAIIPSHRSGPSLMKNTLIGILAGFVLGAGVVTVRFLLVDNTNQMIMSVDDLHAMYPDMMVLSMIPDMQLSERKNGYYSSYYAEPSVKKKGGQEHGSKRA